MTIVTRHSSPRSGTECPADLNDKGSNRTSSSSRKRMKTLSMPTSLIVPTDSAAPIENTAAPAASASNDKSIEEVNMQIQNCPGSSDGDDIKSVMFETTNLTPVRSAADAGEVVQSAQTGSINTGVLGGCETCENGIQIPVSGDSKRGVKRLAKAKPKGGSSEDTVVVVCRKSRRLQNKNKAKHGSTFMDQDAVRMVELIDPGEELNRKCLFSKILFLGSLDLLPTYCVGPKADNPTNSLRALCIRELAKQRKAALDSKRDLGLEEKRRRTSSEDSETDSSSSGADIENSSVSSQSSQNCNIKFEIDEGDDEFLKCEEHVNSFIKGGEKLTMANPNGEEMNELKDCVEKIIRIGAKIMFVGLPPPADVQELIENSSVPVKNEDEFSEKDDEEWFNWEEHIMSLVQNQNPCSNSITKRSQPSSNKQNGVEDELHPSVTNNEPSSSCISR